MAGGGLEDAATRVALRDLYLTGWYEYLAMGSAGLVPWAPVTDREAEAAALAGWAQFAEAGAANPGFAEMLDTAPALLLVLADLSALAAVDRDLPRYTLAGGASIYPFVWSILLAARGPEGLAGVMTTMPVRRESEVRALLEVPDTFAVASLVVLGRPSVNPRRSRLRRAEVQRIPPGWTGSPVRRSPDQRQAPRGLNAWPRTCSARTSNPAASTPVTGFYRDGCCNTGAEDVGVHTVCTRGHGGVLGLLGLGGQRPLDAAP